MGEEENKKEASWYCIKVKGLLDPSWSNWFDGFRISTNIENETRIEGSVRDQSDLHGLLAKVRDLGLPLISVEQLSKKEAYDEKY